MAKFGDGGELVKCSFCGKTQKQVKKLIAGPGVYICDECVDLCMDIRRAESSDAEAPEPTSDQEMAKMKEERLAALNTARQSRREAVHRLDEAVRALQRAGITDPQLVNEMINTTSGLIEVMGARNIIDAWIRCANAGLISEEHIRLAQLWYGESDELGATDPQ